MSPDFLINGLSFPMAYADALILSLLLSLIWAPVVHLAALYLDRGQKLNISEKIWIIALGVAVLPALLTPALTAAGISLRPAAPMETIAEPVVYVMAETAAVAEELSIAPAAEPLFTVTKAISLAGVLYFYGALMALFLWAAKSIAFAFTVASAKRVRDAKLLAAVDAWRVRMGVSVHPLVKQSARVSSVCVSGIFRPVILLPAEIDGRISPDDLVLMCAHEMAHIRRGDAKLFALTAMMRVVFWFNPAIRKLAARAELCAEQSADALVVARGANRRAYAACFVEGLKFAADKSQRKLVAVPTFTPFDREGRRRRLDSILSHDPSDRMSASKRAVLLAAGAVAATIAFGQAALAVDPERTVRESSDTASLEMMPVNGTISLAFGDRMKGETDKAKPPHKGVDIKAPLGTDIVAPGPGTVIEATDLYLNQPGWGKVIVIDHGGGLLTRYAHLDSYAVTAGDKVWTGDIIGKVGATGRSTGPHLHFETIVDGEQINPLVALGVDSVVAPTEGTPAALRKEALNQSLDEALAGKGSPVSGETKDTKRAGAIERTMSFSLAQAPGDLVEFEQFAEMKALEALGGLNALADLSVLAEIAAPEAAADPSPAPEPIISDGAINQHVDGVVQSYRFEINHDNDRIVVSQRRKLTESQRAAVEESLQAMREQMESERERRREAVEASRETREAARTHKREAQKHASAMKRHEASHQREIERAKRQALAEQSRALQQARRDIEQASRDSAREIESPKRDLKQVERDLKALRLPKAEFEAAKQQITEANAIIEKSAKRSDEALAQAQAKIDAQQAEIERLRAALAAAKQKDKASR